jgi:ADP-ribose pyrophosphatase
MRFELMESEAVYEGFLKIRRHRLRHESFNGDWCRPVIRERIEGLRAVSILLYDPGVDRVVLIEQFRIGAMEHPHSSWLLETVGGYWGPGEQAADVARREAREEAGCELLALESIGEFYVSPGLTSERIALFCGCARAASAGGIHGLIEEGEETRVVVLPRLEAIEELFKRINSTSALIALQWLSVHAERLQRQWGALL